MATIKMQANKSQSSAGLMAVTAYIKSKKKTTLENGRRLITGINCTPELAYEQFMLTKKNYHKTDGKMFYHCIQSFSPKEKVSPEEVHQIGIELAERFEKFKGYEIVVATHLDKEHLHNHLVINSVNQDTGRKIHFEKKDIKILMDFSDTICREHNLSTLTPYNKTQTKGMNHGEYSVASKGASWKFRLINEIENGMKISQTKDEFITYMEYKGYKVNWTDSRSNICYTTPDGIKCRDYRLHEEKFLKENMENEFKFREIEESQHRESTTEFDSDIKRDGNLGTEDGQNRFGDKNTVGNNFNSYENEFGGTTEFDKRTGWEDTREYLYTDGEKTFQGVYEDNADYNNLGYGNISDHAVAKGVLGIVKSLSRIDYKHDEDATAALSIVTGLAAATITVLIEILKSQNEEDLTEDFIEDVVEELREQEIQYENDWKNEQELEDEQEFDDEQDFGGMSM